MLKFLLLSSFFLSSTAFAHSLNLKNYLVMQEALASDNFKAALEVHKTICEKDLGHYAKDSYHDCKKDFKDISELRESFKKLSQVAIKNGEKKEMKGLMKVNCPMAEADWIQKEGPIRNPYYGKSMLDCGAKI